MLYVGIEVSNLQKYFKDNLNTPIVRQIVIQSIALNKTIRTMAQEIIVNVLTNKNCIVHENIIESLNFQTIFKNSFFEIKNPNFIDLQITDHIDTELKDIDYDFQNSTLEVSIKGTIKFFKLEKSNKILVINENESIYSLTKLMRKNIANVHNLTYNSIELDLNLNLNKLENVKISDVFIGNTDKIITLTNTRENTNTQENSICCKKIFEIIENNMNSPCAQVLSEIRTLLLILNQQMKDTSQILLSMQENSNKLLSIQDVCDCLQKHVKAKR